ncbi:MAG: hypothetical protein GYA35_02700 [Thermoanaerobaculaceae bacterium]|nr:hypothetical protein [Thermoanaerobaculaceae bacterium]
MIKSLYKPKNKNVENVEEELPIELRKQRAQHAWELLHTWKTIPRNDESGKINYYKLKDWVEKARELCRYIDRLEVCDSHIGQVFAYSLPDEDGNWPPEAICKIVEEIGSKELGEGFITGTLNKRGVVTKSLFEGGDQERKLVGMYNKYSQELAIKFPRMSAILKKIAEYYENQAEREDKEAEKRDLEW